MEFKLTERDKKLLVFLGAFLIIIGFVKLVILPAVDRREELETELTDAQATKEAMESLIMIRSSLEVQYEALKEQSVEALEDYYPIMTTQEVDREITGIVVARQAEAVNLSISIGDEPPQLEMYYAAPQASAQELSGEEAVSGDSTSETSVNVNDPSSMDSVGTSDSGDAQAQTEQQNLFSTLRAASVSLSVKGSREQLDDILDTFFTECPGIHVNSYSYSEASGDEEDARPALNISMDLYMCEKESIQ